MIQLLLGGAGFFFCSFVLREESSRPDDDDDADELLERLTDFAFRPWLVYGLARDNCVRRGRGGGDGSGATPLAAIVPFVTVIFFAIILRSAPKETALAVEFPSTRIKHFKSLSLH